MGMITNHRRPSMLDVAQQAGVSKSTVSCVLNGKPGTSQETRDRILLACDQMGYKINPNIQDFVREAVSGSTRNIAFVFVETEFADPAYARLIDGVARGTCENNYHLLFAKLTGAEESVYDLPPILRDGRVDGVLVSGELTPETTSLLRQLEKPVVILGNYSDAVTKGSSSVEIGVDTAVHLIVKKLKEMGKSRVAFFNETMTHYMDRQMLEVYKFALSENRLPVDESIVYVGSGAFTGAMRLLKPVFEQDRLPFDSICCLDYRCATEISHLIMGRCWKKEVDVVLATLRPYSYYKLPVPTIYADSLTEDSAHEAVLLLMESLAAGPAFRPKRITMSPVVIGAEASVSAK
jgi:LacI family transcriptional regulator